MNELQAKRLAATDKAYVARKIRGQWVVWCEASDHVVEFNEPSASTDDRMHALLQEFYSRGQRAVSA